MDVYYRSLHPTVRRYFLEQIVPTFRHVRERITLNFIPYGPTNDSLSFDEECEANTKLCESNKLQACALNKYYSIENEDDELIQWDGQNQTISYIECMFRNIDNLDLENLSTQCANENFVGDTVGLTECAEQNEGIELLKSMRAKTLGLSEIVNDNLTVVINGEVNADALTDLQTAICDNMKGDKPDNCDTGLPSKVQLQFHYSALNRKSANYLLEELYPNYRSLEGILDVEVIPFGLMEFVEYDSGSYTLNCPKGSNECLANSIHACIVSKYWNEDIVNESEFDGKLQFLDFLKCYYTHSEYPNDVVSACSSCIVQNYGDHWSDVDECARNQTELKAILEQFRDKVDSLVPSLTYQPWITLNSRHNYAVENHITRSVCDLYESDEKPSVCNNILTEQPIVGVQIHYEPRHVNSKSFFVSQFNLSLTHIDSLTTIELIPFGRTTNNGTDFVCVNDEGCHHTKLQVFAIESLFSLFTVLAHSRRVS